MRPVLEALTVEAGFHVSAAVYEKILVAVGSKVAPAGRKRQSHPVKNESTCAGNDRGVWRASGAALG